MWLASGHVINGVGVAGELIGITFLFLQELRKQSGVKKQLDSQRQKVRHS